MRGAGKWCASVASDWRFYSVGDGKTLHQRIRGTTSSEILYVPPTRDTGDGGRGAPALQSRGEFLGEERVNPTHCIFCDEWVGCLCVGQVGTWRKNLVCGYACCCMA